MYQPTAYAVPANMRAFRAVTLTISPVGASLARPAQTSPASRTNCSIAAKALEECARGANRVFRRTKPNAEGESGLVTCLRRLEKCVHRPTISLGWVAARVHGSNVDAGVLLHQVDPRARRLNLVANRRPHRKPVALRSAEIGRSVVHRAILLNQVGHQIVDWL